MLRWGISGSPGNAYEIHFAIMRPSAQRFLLLYLLLTASAAASVWAYRLGWEHRAYGQASTSSAITTHAFADPRTGVAFRYPAGHLVEVIDRSTPQRLHYQIVVAPDTDEYRALKAGNLPGREWPNLVTIDVYDNRFEQVALADWITKRGESNWKLGDGALAETTLGGHLAYRYRYDGLYRTDAVAAVAYDFVYLFSYGMISDDDPIRFVADQVEWTLDITMPELLQN